MSEMAGPGRPGEEVLRLDNVWKAFGDTEVLRGVDLTVASHQVVALIGASGSGKSTLLRTINLLERVDDGQVFLCGIDISRPEAPSQLSANEMACPRPHLVRDGTAFSLDGVVDAKGQVWFLEANCNPQLHPAFYDVMLNGIFCNEA